MASPPETFAAWLRRQRLARNLTQEQLAEQIDVSVVLISKCEQGTRQPGPKTLAKLAGLFGVSPPETAGLLAAPEARRKQLAPAAPPAGLRATMPHPPTQLRGRAAESRRLRSLLLDAGPRLVTIVGPPGVGKTHLSLAVAAELGAEFADGAAFVALAAERDPLRALETIARELGLLQPDRPPLACLADGLRSRGLLLVLDNLEQLKQALGPQLQQLLGACPGLKLLVTSRAPLAIRGEQQLPLEPLPLPEPHLSLDDLARNPAVALFVERAQAVQPGFALQPANSGQVLDICRRLDGVPLAIELAAARSKLLGPRELLSRLRQHFDLLSDGPWDLPDRHRSLHSAITWSYELLGPAEQALFRRLGISGGPYSLDLIEQLAAGLGQQGAITVGERAGRPPATLALLQALVDQSLVRAAPLPAGQQFTLLETIRGYAAELLVAHGEAEPTWRLLCDYALGLVEAPEAQQGHPEHPGWLARIAADYPHIRAALESAAALPDKLPAARLANGLFPFWSAAGYWREGQRRLEQLADPRHSLPPGLQTRLACHAGRLARRLGSYQQARGLFERCLRDYRAAGERAEEAFVLNLLGLTALHQGQYPEAQGHFAASLGLWQALGNQTNEVAVRGNLAMLAADQGDFLSAERQHQEILALRQALDDQLGVAHTLCNRGLLALYQEDFPRARAYFAESLELATRFSSLTLQAAVHCNLGYLALYGGDAEAAAHPLQQSLAIYRGLDDLRGIAYALRGLGAVAAGRRGEQGAAFLLGAADALCQRIRLAIPAAEQAAYRRLLDALLPAARDARFEAAWSQGRAAALDAVIAAAQAV